MNTSPRIVLIHALRESQAPAWDAFARTGKPDHPGIPHWPPFNAQTRAVMDFNLKSRVVDDPLSEVRQALAAAPSPPRR